MQDKPSIENDFLNKLTGIIEENISDEQFGVSELAQKIGMSRSNLLRRIKKLTDLSASQFINQVRLKNAMILLKEQSYTVSEISYKVGFGSTSYFIKCFREQYGYPPGELGKKAAEEISTKPDKLSLFFRELKRRKVTRVITVYAAAAFVILELVSIIAEPLRLPDWTLSFVIVLLLIGLTISLILSWIYDIKPEGGLEKTSPLNQTSEKSQSSSPGWKIASFISFVVIIALIVLHILPLTTTASVQAELEKSIAVLPFKNESNDSTNIYIINGLMESLLDNLQKIEDLRVISRTSVEKYRNNPKSIAEIAGELSASYLVEGSGQKIGDQILLNVQLIEASTDKHLWAERYKREAVDIFELQLEVAKRITEEIEAIITPEEAQLIEKVPTKNLEAYDYYLKGMLPFQQETRAGLEEAIPLFKKAVELDPEFALAHANISIAYVILDMYQFEKKHGEQIDYHADKALLYDPKLPQGLIAKAFLHILRTEYELALPYLEKALEYHPNSSRVLNILSDFYTRYIPNTEKYLEYALKGIELDIAAHDSVQSSYIYLHLSNAFMQSGFVKEAEKYLGLSLHYFPDNVYAGLLKPYILLAGGGTLLQTKTQLIQLLQKYPDRYDIMKEIAVICYYMRDYACASDYFSSLFEITAAQGLDMYKGEKAKLGLALSKLGRMEESSRYFREYLEFAKEDQSIYKDLSMAAYFASQGNAALTIEHMRLFSQQEKYPYWYILFLRIDDPLFENVQELPEFQELLKEIEEKFWRYHEELSESLKEKGLL